jgi:hypothetical protein
VGRGLGRLFLVGAVLRANTKRRRVDPHRTPEFHLGLVLLRYRDMVK